MRPLRGWLAAALLIAVLPTQAADPAKVLRVAFEQDPTGFDPQAASDTYSTWINRGIFDTLLEYGYVKRPYALKPLAAQSLPEIRDGGRTFVFRIRPGIYFTPDPAFRGKPRELVAEDYVYSWRRLIDPRMRSFWGFYLDDKLVGADELVAAARANGKFDYDAKLEGLRALDRYTLQVKLKEPDYLLIERMTTQPMAAVAREIVEAYGTPGNGWTMDNPLQQEYRHRHERFAVPSGGVPPPVRAGPGAARQPRAQRSISEAVGPCGSIHADHGRHVSLPQHALTPVDRGLAARSVSFASRGSTSTSTWSDGSSCTDPLRGLTRSRLSGQFERQQGPLARGAPPVLAQRA